MVERWHVKGKYGAALGLLLLCSSLVQAMGPDTAALVAEARAVAAAGDRGAAAVLYHRALQREDADQSLRADLAALIVSDAQGFDGERVESDILNALEHSLKGAP